MLQKITEEELEFMELFHDPVAMLENLVPKNIDAPSNWTEDTECIKIRLYQLPTLSFEYMVAQNPEKTDQENFDLKKGAGQIYNIGGRKFGKSFITLFCDGLCTIIHCAGWVIALASFDHKHLKKIMEDICNYVELHPFFKIFHLQGGRGGTGIKTVSRSPYSIKTRHGVKFFGINENVSSPNPGTDYHQHHYHKFFYEEASYESEEGHQKRIDSTSELGAIERLSGIPDVTDTSYLGMVLSNPSRQNQIVRLPQFVRETWNEEQKIKAIEEHGGEGSVGYKLNVLGERIEGAYGIFDLERIKECYNSKKKVITFDINKDNFENYKVNVILDKMPSDVRYICADIGESAPTEIVIFYKINDRIRYAYNITLNRLTADEQAEVFKWLYSEVGGAFVGLDCTDGTGRAIYTTLSKTIPGENLMFVQFSKSIVVGFEEEDGKIVTQKKSIKAIPKEENTKDWADTQLARLFYDKKLELCLDEKFYKQISGYKYIQSGTRRVKRVLNAEDHLLQAFQVLAVTIWDKEFKKPIKKKRDIGTGAI